MTHYMLSLNHSVYIALLLALTASLHNQAYASQANESALPNLFSSTVIYQSQGEKLVNTIIKKRDWRGKLCLQDLDRQTHPGYQPPIGRIIFSIHEHGITQYPSPGDYFQNCSLDVRQSISTPFTEPLQPFENHQGLLGCALTGCTVNDLSGFYIENHDDEGDWKYRTIALSFDPEAQLLIEKIQGLGRNEHVSHLNQEQTLAFTYPLDKGDKIDFSGIWRQTLYQAQTMQYRCLLITPQAIRLGPTGQHECPTQETLYRIDISDQFRAMWWRDNPEPYAQLAQLNTTVTWYDPDLGRQWVSWEYQPAGKNWDLGVLYRFQQQKFLDNAGMERLRLLHASEFVKQHDSQLKS
ncbi:chromosome partitioning protein ParA [Vibrio fujianensis]|uniref:chromosome partitioning protein ParA n=1 Tax=Vibrio fujianensis TaxID=1974215 RepID=UPI000C168FE3|nr:chromosome partitioning protein ParA [Vibrio fujianensis]